MESKLKHLELIQGVVNRLATDSFRVKGWTVVLVTALFVLLAIEDRLHVAYIALTPVLVFWGLDGYYLWQERLFRALYDHVRVVDESEVDFSMATAAFRTGWKRSWIVTVQLPWQVGAGGRNGCGLILTNGGVG